MVIRCNIFSSCHLPHQPPALPCFRLTLGALLLLCLTPTTATEAADEGRSPRRRSFAAADLGSFDAFARRLMSCRRIPGLTLALVDAAAADPDQSPSAAGRQRPLGESSASDGGVVLRQYGVTDVDTGQPVTADTRHCISSCTKAFTTTLLGKLLQETGYTWDTPLSTILTDGRADFNDAWVTDHVTIRDVLLHRTGVHRTYDELWLFAAFDRDDAVRRIRFMDSSSSFRSQSVYNNVVYSLAGHVTETLGGGLEWETLLRRRLLEPLNMSSTSFYHARDSPHQFTRPHIHVTGHPNTYDTALIERGTSTVASSLSMCTTSGDMAVWMRALLDAVSDDDDDAEARQRRRRPCSATPASTVAAGRRCDDAPPVLPPSVVRESFRTQVVAMPMFVSELKRPKAVEPLDIDGYGLGWFTGHYRGWEVVMHYGSLIGFYSMITLIPELDLGIFTSYNGAVQTDPYTVNSLLHVYLIDRHLGLDPWLDDDNQTTEWCRIPVEQDPAEVPKPRRTSSTPEETRPPLWRPREAYTGDFHHPVLGPLRVYAPPSTARASSLMARYGLLEMALVPQSETSFLAVPVDRTWVSLLGSINVVFSAFDDGRRTYGTLALRLLGSEPTAFSRPGVAGVSGGGGNTKRCSAQLCWTLCVSVTVCTWLIQTLISRFEY